MSVACIGLLSLKIVHKLQVLIKFITNNGLLEDISANVHYANITKQSYSQQFYQFDANFIEISSNLNGVKVDKKSLGYDMGQVIRIESIRNGKFAISSGMECNNRKRQINVRLGIQINTACRLRYASESFMLISIIIDY